MYKPCLPDHHSPPSPSLGLGKVGSLGKLIQAGSQGQGHAKGRSCKVMMGSKAKARARVRARARTGITRALHFFYFVSVWGKQMKLMEQV